MIKKHLFLLIAVLFTATTFAQTGLKKGDRAPLFTATDNAGKTINLATILRSHKAVVVFFYRGQWCPYCNKHVQQLQDSLHLLTTKGIYVVGITPETGENVNKTIEKTHASFSIIPDKGYRIMQDYKVNYTLDDATVNKYKGFGLDLDKNNGANGHVLPVPATYLIDHTGKIIFVHFNKDYTKRASVSDILQAL